MFAYIRVSTDRQDLSIEAQQNQIRRAAAHFCPDEDLDTLRIFAEPDTSGSIRSACGPLPAQSRLSSRA